MLLPTCYFSFLGYICRKSATCNGKKICAITCVAKACSASFDLWMPKGGVDTFALVINYLNESWMP